MMTNDVARTIARHHMIKAGDTVIVALSGGPDSVALLLVLHELRDELRCTLAAAHLNHMLRGADADADEQFVRDLCAQLDVPLHAASRDIEALARERRIGVEECGRVERYRLLRAVAVQYERAKIATAHHRGDVAETFFINLMRGSGLRGLGSIPPVRGPVIRPLYDVTRGDIERYLHGRRQSYRVDVTNNDTTYLRSFVRHDVLVPLVRRQPAFLAVLARTIDSLRDDESYLTHTAGRRREMLRVGAGVDAARLRHEPVAIRRRVIRLLCDEAGIAADSRAVQRIEALLRHGGATQLPGAACARVQRHVLTVERERGPQPQFCTPLAWGAHALVDGKTLLVRELDMNKMGKIKKSAQNHLISCIDCDRITGNVEIRSRRPGDSIRLAGRGVTKSLKKLLSEDGWTLSERDRLHVIADELGPLWVEGYGVAERAAVNENTVRCAYIRVVPGQEAD